MNLILNCLLLLAELSPEVILDVRKLLCDSG